MYYIANYYILLYRLLDSERIYIVTKEGILTVPIGFTIICFYIFFNVFILHLFR